MDGVVCTAEIEAACADGSGGGWRPLLLMLPLRLGLARFHPPYAAPLAALLALPQSAGMLGGRPRRSFFFAGVQGEGEGAAALYYDPHTPQPALGYAGGRGGDGGTTRGARWPLSEADVASCHCAGLRQMRLAELDPSLALAFLCASRADFDAWLAGARAALDACGPASAFLEIRPHPIPVARRAPAAPAAVGGGAGEGGAPSAPAAARDGSPLAASPVPRRAERERGWAETDDEDDDLVLV